MFGNALSRLEELHVIDIAFLHGCQVPTIVFIYQVHVCWHMHWDKLLIIVFNLGYEQLCTLIGSLLKCDKIQYTVSSYSMSRVVTDTNLMAGEATAVNASFNQVCLLAHSASIVSFNFSKKDEKETLCGNHVISLIWSCHRPDFRTSHCVFMPSNWFLRRKWIIFVGELKVKTKPTLKVCTLVVCYDFSCTHICNLVCFIFAKPLPRTVQIDVIQNFVLQKVSEKTVITTDCMQSYRLSSLQETLLCSALLWICTQEPRNRDLEQIWLSVH